MEWGVWLSTKNTCFQLRKDDDKCVYLTFTCQLFFLWLYILRLTRPDDFHGRSNSGDKLEWAQNILLDGLSNYVVKISWTKRDVQIGACKGEFEIFTEARVKFPTLDTKWQTNSCLGINFKLKLETWNLKCSWTPNSPQPTWGSLLEEATVWWCALPILI